MIEEPPSSPALWRAASWRAGLRARWRHSTGRLVLAATLLGAACLTWAATPPGTAGGGGPAVITLAACCLAGGAIRLAVAGVPRPDTGGY
ncbi:MAG TPA: hypothetical protein VIP48_12655, partial [Streptosporangiaceae bacterium]